MKNIPAPIKQEPSQGGRVMRQERQAASVKSMDAAKKEATKIKSKMTY